MRIPEYWSESSLKVRLEQREITVRRFGWSDESQADADRHASKRAEEAAGNIAAGRQVARRERKISYNGADDLPIREEVLERYGDFVVTRNGYGARCLNTPNIFFADIDFDGPRFSSFHFWLSFFMAAVGCGILIATTPNTILALVAFIPLMAVSLLAVNLTLHLMMKLRGGNQRVSYKRIERFLEKNPDWHLRIYRTPHGYRVLAIHDVLAPRSSQVADAFKDLNVDRTYVRMCQKQNCFRARLTAKPWRAGFGERLSRAVWPIEDATALAARRDWVEQYEQAARRFAACRFERALGATQRVSPEAEELRRYHDEACQANSDLPLA